MHIALIAPCHNEGEVAVRFIAELRSVLARTPHDWSVVVVDDASTDNTIELLRSLDRKAGNTELILLSLAYNMGHQEAIYQGLLHASTLGASRFVVMDSDGEDDPDAILSMMTSLEYPVVLVARGKRSESLAFRIGYTLYRVLFKFITGRSISFGNFSMIDRGTMEAVIDRSFIHYAAFLSRLKVPYKLITYDRRRRIDGRSKMSIHNLSVHAFRSLIEYSNELLAIFLKGFMILLLLLITSLLSIVYIKVFTDHAIPGWASMLSASLFNSMLLCLGFFALGLLLSNTAQRRDRAGRHLYKRVSSDGPGQ